MIRCSGRGDLLMNAFGQFHFISIPSEQSYVIDARYLVGLDDQMSIRIRRVGGVRTVGLANEERAIEVQGPGRLIMQTRAREFPRNKA